MLNERSKITQVSHLTQTAPNEFYSPRQAKRHPGFSPCWSSRALTGRVFKTDIKNETGFVAKNATTNGDDASRVGIEKGGKIRTLLNNSCIFTRRETRRPH